MKEGSSVTIFSNNVFAGKHALVTGATGGIGRATARLLAQMGAAVTITGRKEELLAQVKREILEQRVDARVVAIRADVTNEEERKTLVEQAERHAGPITLLVNNAGAFEYAFMEDVTQESMERLMNINYTSVVLLTQKIYAGMKRLGEGAIVNVSSLSGLRGVPGGTAYCASKFALIGFTHSLALEAISHGVRVNAVCPGYVDTAMGHDVISSSASAVGVSVEQRWKQVNGGIPSGKITQPEEVANTIAYLLSDAAVNLVGESVKISGGALLR